VALMARSPSRRRSPPIKKTTIRDFGGGLNVIDTQQNLTSRFSPIFDNTVRYADGSISPRFGAEKWLKLKTGTTASGTLPVGTTITTTLASPEVRVNWTAHPFANPTHAHLTLSGLGAINGIPADELNGVHSVRYVNANEIAFFVRTDATSAGAVAVAGEDYTVDNHAIGGNVVDAFYFNDYVIIVDSIGEISRVNPNKVIERIWDYTIANGLGGSPPPWGTTELVAKDYWSGQAILSNGVDKSLRIDFTETNIVDYQVDPGMGSSNVAIPAFDACKSAFQFFVVHDTETTTSDMRPVVRISAKKTSVVFADSTDPGDAVDVDVSKIIANPDSVVIAFGIIKDKLMVIMPTSSVFLQLGNYVEIGTDRLHDPVAADTMPNVGTSARRSVIEVGNDIFMLDYNGVPSARLSSMQNTIVPERVSQLIEPMISAHIGRLSADTMRLDAFGVYDPKNKGVLFCLPKYDEDDLRNLALNPFAYSNTNKDTNTLLVFIDSHQIEIGDQVLIAGATGFGQLSAGQLNTTHNVVGILSEDILVIDYVGTAITNTTPQSGGGAAVTLKPINDETVMYWYHYVPSLKINSWSRFKTRPFNAGCSTAMGTLFLFDDDNMYRLGSLSDPVYGDDFNDFDVNWATSTAYVVGQRVRDTDTQETFTPTSDLTSASSGTFAEEREADPVAWTPYLGEPVEMVWELPWADFGTRQDLKMLQHVHIDATGTGRFKVEAFVDNIYRNGSLGELTPVRSIEFIAGDSAGYGAGDQPFGAGRRTREQFLWPLPVRFKLLKLRITASAVQPIRINAISFLYQQGGVVRT
jgi:hypothetical protein